MLRDALDALVRYTTPQAQSVAIDCGKVNDVLIQNGAPLYVEAAEAVRVQYSDSKLSVGELIATVRVRLHPADAKWPLRERMSQRQLKRVYTLINPELQMREAEGWGAVEVDYDGAPIAREEARAALQDSDVQQLLRRAGFAGVFDDVYGCGGPEWKDVTFSAFAAELESRQPPHPAAVFIRSVPGVPTHLDVARIVEHNHVDGACLRSWCDGGLAEGEGAERIAVELKEGLLGESLMSAHVRAVCAELGRVVAESVAPAGVGGTLARLVAKAAGTAASPRTVDIESVSVRIATPDGAPVQVMLSGAHVNLSGVGCDLSAASLRTEGGGAPFEASDVEVRFADDERPLSVSAKHARVCWHPLLSAVVPATAVRSLKVGSLSVLVPGLPEFTVTGLDGRPHGDAPMNVTVSCPGVLPEPAQATWQDGGLTIAAGTAVTLNAEHWAALRRTVAEATQPPHRVGALGGTAAGVAIAAPAIELQCGDRPWTLKNGRLELRHSDDAAALTVSADEAGAADRKCAGLRVTVTRTHGSGGVSVSGEIGELALHSAESGPAASVLKGALRPLLDSAAVDLSVGALRVSAPQQSIILRRLVVARRAPEAGPALAPRGTPATAVSWDAGSVSTAAGGVDFASADERHSVKMSGGDDGSLDMQAAFPEVVVKGACTPGDLPAMTCALLDAVRLPGRPRSRLLLTVTAGTVQHTGWRGAKLSATVTGTPQVETEDSGEEAAAVALEATATCETVANRCVSIVQPAVDIRSHAGVMTIDVRCDGVNARTGPGGAAAIRDVMMLGLSEVERSTLSLQEMRDIHTAQLERREQHERLLERDREAAHQAASSGAVWGYVASVFGTRAIEAVPEAPAGEAAADERGLRLADLRSVDVIADYSPACAPAVRCSDQKGPMQLRVTAHVQNLEASSGSVTVRTADVRVSGAVGEPLVVEADGAKVYAGDAAGQRTVVLHTGGGVKAEYDGEVRVSLDGGLTADLRDRVPAAAVSRFVRQLRFGDTKVSVQTPTSALFMLPQEASAAADGEDVSAAAVRTLLESVHAIEGDGCRELLVLLPPTPLLPAAAAAEWASVWFRANYIDAWSWRGVSQGVRRFVGYGDVPKEALADAADADETAARKFQDPTTGVKVLLNPDGTYAFDTRGLQMPALPPPSREPADVATIDKLRAELERCRAELQQPPAPAPAPGPWIADTAE